MKEQKFTVCYFGTYDPNYSRSRIIVNGLRANGVEVLECNDGAPFFKKYFNLIKKHRAFKGKYDAMIVGFPGFQVMILAKLLTRKPIFFDAFASLYDSMILDRKLARKISLRGLYCWWMDWLSMKLADIVLFDTNQNINFASEKFGIKKEKFRRVLVGAETDIYQPSNAEKAAKDDGVF